MELQQVYTDSQDLDAEILGISMDTITETSILAKTLGVTYKLLSDPNGKVAKEYGVYNLLGDGLATPAIFVINDSKTIDWNYVGKSVGDRPDTSDIIKRLEGYYF